MAPNRRDLAFATLNLTNLQLPGEPMYPGSRRYDADAYAAKVAWTAATIRRLHADVVAFHELWSPAALVDVFRAAGLGDTYRLAFIKADG